MKLLPPDSACKTSPRKRLYTLELARDDLGAISIGPKRLGRSSSREIGPNLRCSFGRLLAGIVCLKYRGVTLRAGRGPKELTPETASEEDEGRLPEDLRKGFELDVDAVLQCRALVWEVIPMKPVRLVQSEMHPGGEGEVELRKMAVSIGVIMLCKRGIVLSAERLCRDHVEG